MQTVHIISIGGAAMHNIALDLHSQGYVVTGSDDEIYEPSLTRLKISGILPDKFGWYPEKIHTGLDFIILGMHAKSDNPELQKAIQLGLTVYSYPEYIYKHSINKKRVVIAGSHGKTTTTAMIMHVLKKSKIKFDYLVGAQLPGFDRMVQLSDAPLIIIEGDEYLSSAVDRIPKILHYRPHIALLTGIAWDHVNVFPSFEIYKEQFALFIKTIESDGELIYFKNDPILVSIVEKYWQKKASNYEGLSVDSNKRVIWRNKTFSISCIGLHNLWNMHGAMLVCNSLGISSEDFLEAMNDFTGANKRLQKISETKNRVVYLDFAHAPSKVIATTQSFKEWFGAKKLIAIFELHTFSSLNIDFMNQYKSTLNAADEAIVFFNEHTLQMKNMPPLEFSFVQEQFGHPNLSVINDEKELHRKLEDSKYKTYNILLMTSGNFNNMSLDF